MRLPEKKIVMQRPLQNQTQTQSRLITKKNRPSHARKCNFEHSYTSYASRGSARGISSRRSRVAQALVGLGWGARARARESRVCSALAPRLYTAETVSLSDARGRLGYGISRAKVVGRLSGEFPEWLVVFYTFFK